MKPKVVTTQMKAVDKIVHVYILNYGNVLVIAEENSFS